MNPVPAHLSSAHRMAELRFDDDPWASLRVDALQVETTICSGSLPLERRDCRQVDTTGPSDQIQECCPQVHVVEEKSERVCCDNFVEPSSRESPKQRFMTGHAGLKHTKPPPELRRIG